VIPGIKRSKNKGIVWQRSNAMNGSENRTRELRSLFGGDWFRIPFDSVIGLWIKSAAEKRDLRRGIFENHFGGANWG
jgi:hypothetical protein